MKRLAVIGGSSPFTVDLIESLATAATGPLDLMLQGRNRAELELVRSYAEKRLEPLGWAVDSRVERREALRGADIVLQQIRFGGSAGRAADEALALSHGLPADETLGPAALQSALRMRSDIDALGREIADTCPDAIVLNLTNPLSLATTLLRLAGVARVAGLCELPLETARVAAALAGADPDNISWSYAGLNHRGFVCGLAQGGEPLLPRFLAALGERSFSGATAAEIAELGAIPTKYFALLTGRTRATPGRAEAVAQIRNETAAELRADPGRFPPSLRRRGGTWYQLAVVPAIAALCSEESHELVLTVPCADGVSRESLCSVSASQIAPMTPPTPPPTIQPWLATFETHERSMLAAVRSPSRSSLRQAVADDPLVPPAQVEKVFEALMRQMETA